MIAVPAWHEALSGFDILAISLAVGAIVSLRWLLPAKTGTAPWGREIRRRLRRLLGASLALLSLTSVAILVARSMAASGRPLAEVAGVLPLVLAHTDFGHLWWVRAGAVILLWIGWSRMRTDRRQPFVQWLLLACIAAVAYTRSATGHAGDHGDFQLSVWIDWVHLLAAGLWGGVVIAFVVSVHPVLRRAIEVDRSVIVLRLSGIAAAGLGLVAASGVYNAWHALGGWRPLWTTRYGLILDVKLGFVVLMALLGATNRFRHVPGVTKAGGASSSPGPERSRAFRALVVTSTLEALLMLAILAAVALLVNAMPPTDVP